MKFLKIMCADETSTNLRQGYGGQASGSCPERLPQGNSVSEFSQKTILRVQKY